MGLGHHVEWVDAFFYVLEDLEDLVCFGEGVDETAYFFVTVFVAVWEIFTALLAVLHLLTN